MSTQPQFLSHLSSAQATLTTSHMTQHVPNSQGATTNVLPKALPICPKPNATSLPSSEIKTAYRQLTLFSDATATSKENQKQGCSL